MNTLQLQNEYANKIESISSYRVTFSTTNLRVSLTNKNDTRDVIISRARISNNSLHLEPFDTYGIAKKRNFLFVMGYWSAYASMNNLSTFHLIPKININGHVMKTWDDAKLIHMHSLLDSLQQFFPIKASPVFSFEKMSRMFEILLVAEEAFQSKQKQDITFLYSAHRKETTLSFIGYLLKWKGTENKFYFTNLNDDFYLEWNDKSYLLTNDNLSTLMANLFSEIEENVRLKNLVHPPVEHLSKLMKGELGSSTYTSSLMTKELAETIMDELIRLGHSNDEIEAEACRLFKETSAGIDLPPSKLPYLEQTFYFLKKYYVSVVLEENNNHYTHIITENKEDVFSFYMKCHEKYLNYYLPGFQNPTI